MARIGMAELPEELLELILRNLDIAPPSGRKLRQEPSLDLIKSSDTPLKNASRVCKGWRRLVLPFLFKYACVHLDIPWQPSWSSCPACSQVSAQEWDENNPALREVDQYHVEMAKEQTRRLQDRRKRLKRIDHDPKYQAECALTEDLTAPWAWRFYHVLKDFCEFIKLSNVGRSIDSFVVTTNRQLTGLCGRLQGNFLSRERRYQAASMFWRHLYSYIQPFRVVIVAPPTELLLLTNASAQWQAEVDDNVLKNMDFHILELRFDLKAAEKMATPSPEYTIQGSLPARVVGFASNSLIYLHPWTHVTLNEGSYLRAYGSLEYFERGPPVHVYSVKQCFVPFVDLRRLDLPSLRSLTYIAIFPFARDLRIAEWFPNLEELDVQFAPNPESKILDDRARVGRAELADCWHQLIQAYQSIAETFSTALMSREAFPRLKRVVCRDFEISQLSDELDEIFTFCCLPVWVEYTRGVYTRAAMSPHPEQVNE